MKPFHTLTFTTAVLLCLIFCGCPQVDPAFPTCFWIGSRSGTDVERKTTQGSGQSIQEFVEVDVEMSRPNGDTVQFVIDFNYGGSDNVTRSLRGLVNEDGSQVELFDRILPNLRTANNDLYKVTYSDGIAMLINRSCNIEIRINEVREFIDDNLAAGNYSSIHTITLDP